MLSIFRNSVVQYWTLVLNKIFHHYLSCQCLSSIISSQFPPLLSQSQSCMRSSYLVAFSLLTLSLWYLLVYQPFGVPLAMLMWPNHFNRLLPILPLKLSLVTTLHFFPVYMIIGTLKDLFVILAFMGQFYP